MSTVAPVQWLVMVSCFSGQCLYSFAEELPLLWEAATFGSLLLPSIQGGNLEAKCSGVTGCEFLAALFTFKRKEYY